MVLWWKHGIKKHYVSFVQTYEPIASQKHMKFIVIYNEDLHDVTGEI